MLLTTVLHYLVAPEPWAQHQHAKELGAAQTAPDPCSGPGGLHTPRDSKKHHGEGHRDQRPRGPQAGVVRYHWEPYPGSQENVPLWQEMPVLPLKVETVTISL